MPYMNSNNPILPRKRTQLEDPFAQWLVFKNIKFVRQFKPFKDRRFACDFYLPDYNVLIEIDGSYWHKKDLTECKTKIQKRNFFNDITKDKLAFKFGYRLIRILEKETDQEIIKILIKELNIKNTTNDLFLTVTAVDADITGGERLFAIPIQGTGINTLNLAQIKQIGQSSIPGTGTYPNGPEVLAVVITALSTVSNPVGEIQLSFQESQA